MRPVVRRSTACASTTSWRFNPLRRGGGRATGRGALGDPPLSGGFQSPPPRRGACDQPSPPSPSPSPPPRRFNPLRRGGGRATGSGGGTWRRHRIVRRFNPLRRGGGRATGRTYVCCSGGMFIAFQSPPPRRGACDGARRQGGGTTRAARFNPLRRGGRRATGRRRGDARRRGRVVSIPSAEAGGVRPSWTPPGRSSFGRVVSIPSAEAGGVRRGRHHGAGNSDVVAFQSPPPRRGACDSAASWSRSLSRMGSFQSPPPRRGACDSAVLGAMMVEKNEGEVSIPSAEAGGVRPCKEAHLPQPLDH